MRKFMLLIAGLALLTTAGVAVARGVDSGKAIKSVAGTFTAATVSNSQTRLCTTTDGKAISTTNATYTGTASGDPDLTGAITVQLRSTINTTDGVGVVGGKLKIAATGGDTVAQINAVYDHGNIAGIASGHAQDPHAGLLANLSASLGATGGLSSGKLGGATAGGSAVEIGPARCASTKTITEKSEARGTVSAVSSTSVTVGGLTCTVPASLSAKVLLLKLSDRAEVHCSLVGGVNTLVKINAKR
jgi:hypothetical protein